MIIEHLSIILSANSKQLNDVLRVAETRLRDFSQKATSAGFGLVAASGAMLTPLVLATRSFAQFAYEMDYVRALTQATADQFAALEAEAIRLGATTVYTARQAAEAMSFFALAGFEVQTILKAAGPTLALAAAGNLDMAEAADIAAKVMAGSRIPVEDLGHAINVLTKGMTTANTNLRQLGDALKYAGPIAAAAGIEFEELIAAIQILSNAGIQGEMAGVALRTGILHLIGPTQEAAETMENLNIKMATADRRVRSLAEVVGDMARAFDMLPPADRLEALHTIFTVRQAPPFSILVDSVDELRERTERLKNTNEDFAQTIAQMRLNNLYGDFILLASAAETLQIVIGQRLNTALRAMVQTLTGFVRAMVDLVRNSGPLLHIFAGLAAAVGFVGGMLLGAGLAARVFSFALAGLPIILKGLQMALAAVSAAFGFFALTAKASIAALFIADAAVVKAIKTLRDLFFVLTLVQVGQTKTMVLWGVLGGIIATANAAVVAFVRSLWSSIVALGSMNLSLTVATVKTGLMTVATVALTWAMRGLAIAVTFVSKALWLIVLHPVTAVLVAIGLVLVGLAAKWLFFSDTVDEAAKATEKANKDMEQAIAETDKLVKELQQKLTLEAIQTQADRFNELRENVDKLNQSFREQGATLGMSARQAQVHALEMELASQLARQATIDMAAAAMTGGEMVLGGQAEKFNRMKQALEALKSIAAGLDFREAVLNATREVERLTSQFQLQATTVGMSTEKAQAYAATMKLVAFWSAMSLSEQAKLIPKIQQLWRAASESEQAQSIQDIAKSLADFKERLEGEVATFGLHKLEAELLLLEQRIEEFPALELKLQPQIDEVQKLIDKIKELEAAKEANDEADRRWKDFLGRWKDLMEKLKTPTEKYMEMLADINRMFMAGLLTIEQYFRALKLADDEFKKMKGMKDLEGGRLGTFRPDLVDVRDLSAGGKIDPTVEHLKALLTEQKRQTRLLEEQLRRGGFPA